MIFIHDVVSIYFGSVDTFMNCSCNFVRFAKYITTIFSSNLPWSCRTLQNNILFFGLLKLCIEDSHIKVSPTFWKLYFKPPSY